MVDVEVPPPIRNAVGEHDSPEHVAPKMSEQVVAHEPASFALGFAVGHVDRSNVRATARPSQWFFR